MDEKIDLLTDNFNRNYILVEEKATFENHFVDCVNKLIEKGYKPVGGVSSIGVHILQAMIKEG